jgi:phospholipase/carboxylesterase
MTAIDNFFHIYRPATQPDAPTLLLLHGTGGDEQSLVGLADDLAPGAALLSPRGKVLEHGAPRFFRRFAEGVLDIEDLKVRAGELAAFITDAAAHYDFKPESLIAVGYSNGANMAAGLMMLYPQLLKRGVLLRPMQLEGLQAAGSLSETQALILGGRSDEIIPTVWVEGLHTALKAGDAQVTLEWINSGHRLTMDDVAKAKAWIGG